MANLTKSALFDSAVHIVHNQEFESQLGNNKPNFFTNNLLIQKEIKSDQPMLISTIVNLLNLLVFFFYRKFPMLL